MKANESLNGLLLQRGELRAEGKVAEMVRVQLTILEEVRRSGCRDKLANALNYLSTLYFRLSRLAEAEAPAREALSIYTTLDSQSAEVLGCYEFVLARILEGQGRFDEALTFAESSVEHYAVFHDPPDDFLRARQAEVSVIRKKGGAFQ